MPIPHHIPEPYRSRLIDAGVGACAFHERTILDGNGNPDFVASKEYRIAHGEVERVYEDLHAINGVAK